MCDDCLINTALVKGLVWIFSEYTWDADKNEVPFSERFAYIKQGLTEGKAPGFSTHLKMIIQAKEEDETWGILNPDYVRGINKMLDRCIQRYGLSFEPSNFTLDCEIDPRVEGNVFKHDKMAKEALTRLKVYGKTNITYQLYKEYGLKRLTKDLRAAGFPKATIKIPYDNYTGEFYKEYHKYKRDHSDSFRVYWPIMPFVILNANLD